MKLSIHDSECIFYQHRPLPEDGAVPRKVTRNLRVIYHQPGCPKLSGALSCTCNGTVITGASRHHSTYAPRAKVDA